VAREGIVFGGCVYRNLVHSAHASSLAVTASALVGNPQWFVSATDYRHTSFLAQGRSQWLRAQIGAPAKDRASLAVSIDSDTAWDGAALIRDLHLVRFSDVAIGIVPLVIGGTVDTVNINLWDGDDWSSISDSVKARRATMTEARKIVESRSREIHSGGFGLVVFNLGWFGRYWPDPDCTEHISLTQGEDISLCQSVRERGGRIIALNVPAEHLQLVRG
jgi:hypothetical protein